MSIDGVVQKPSSFRRNLAVGLTGLSLLTAGAIAWARIPEQPPNVYVSPGRVVVEPYAYEGQYLTRFSDGRTTLMLVGDMWIGHDFIWYEDTKGDGKVHEIIYGRLYEREKDLAKHPAIFEEADRKLREAVEKYEPHIQMALLNGF